MCGNAVQDDIQFIPADEAWKARLAAHWPTVHPKHFHLADGFTLVALHQQEIVGVISVYWRELPPPLPPTKEGFIDIIEVAEPFRRRGIARRLVEFAAQRAREASAYQLRAWSSEDKTEAIPMWKALGFGLCPATVYPRGEKVEGFFVAKTL